MTGVGKKSFAGSPTIAEYLCHTCNQFAHNSLVEKLLAVHRTLRLAVGLLAVHRTPQLAAGRLAGQRTLRWAVVVVYRLGMFAVGGSSYCRNPEFNVRTINHAIRKS